MYEAQIQQGTTLLNDKWGPGWEENVQLDILDMGDGDVCVLGQLYDTFLYGQCALDLCSADLYSHGFALEAGDTGQVDGQEAYNIYEERYDMLTQEWKETLWTMKCDALSALFQQEQGEEN